MSAKESFNPDPPSTPAELRGPLTSIQTQTGNRFSEVFPMLASRSNSFALLRGLDTGSSDHIGSSNNLALRGNKTVFEGIGEGGANGAMPYAFLNPGRSWPAVNSSFQQNMAFTPSWNEEQKRFIATTMPTNTNLATRRQLLEQFEKGVQIHSPISARMDRFRGTAFDLLMGGGKFFDSFNLPERDRDRYGRGLAGDGLLLARQMVMNGAGAAVLYHEHGGDWDMHGDIENRMKSDTPEVDRAASAIIDDITQNRLDAVFLLCTEFNRTPRVNGVAGRDHWPYGNVAILAGGNVRGGAVHGRTHPQGHIIDGRVEQKGTLGNTLLVATGNEINPASPRVREILR